MNGAVGDGAVTDAAAAASAASATEARLGAGPGTGLEVLTLGETMLLVAPQDGSPLAGAPLCTLGPAGAESNVAMHLARLGHRSGWASRLGADPLGRIVIDAIAGAGVDVSLVESAGPEPTGVMFKDPAPSGTTVHYYRRGSAASTMDAAFLGGLTDASPAIVHATGITPALSESCRLLFEHLVFDRPFADALLSLDVNFRPALWGADAPELLLGYARAADIVFVGLDEAERLWGTTDAASVAALVPDARWLVIKDADREAVSFHGGVATSEPARKIEVVEPVGAGDAFAAGWLSGLLRGLDDGARLRLGHAVAAGVLLSTSDQAELPPDDELARQIGVSDAQWSVRADPRAPVGR